MDSEGEAPPPLVFRLHEGAPYLVREVLLECGWEEYDEQQQESGDWNLYWRLSAFRISDYENLLPWQRLNHHPKTVGITRKDNLARNLKRMRGTYGSAVYNFSPTAFILPNDYTRFLVEYTKHRMNKGGGGGGKLSGYWICKPVDLSRGRGIFIFEDIKDLIYDSSVIVQRYISSPLLISGYKFDLRIYVCVKSFHPLTIYIYKEGLVRFATEKYNLCSLGNLYAHLTNTSINKFGPFYTKDKERVGQGCKWTMSKFRGFLHSQGINELLLWQRINNIVTLTLLTIAPTMPPSTNCVELLGFDVLIDATLKPWLLEVNYSPALSLDCQADVTVKKGLISDLVELMNYDPADSFRQRGPRRQRYKRPCYLVSQSSQPDAPLLPKSKSRRAHQHGRKSYNESCSSPSLPLLKTGRELRSHKRSHSRSGLKGFLTHGRVRCLPLADNGNAHTTSHCAYKSTSNTTRHCEYKSTSNTTRHCEYKSTSNTTRHCEYKSTSNTTRHCEYKSTSNTTRHCEYKSTSNTTSHCLYKSDATSHCLCKSTTNTDSRCLNKSVKPGPHSKTAAVTSNRRTRQSAASSRVTGGFLRAPGFAGDSGMAEVERGFPLKTSNGPGLGLGGLGTSTPTPTPTGGTCVLPDIHSHRHRSSKGPWEQTGAQRERQRTPPLRVGDFILTFPFNRATLKASNDRTLDVKAAVLEVRKLIGRLASGLVKKRRREEEGGGEREQGKGVGKGEFESLFWGPKNPTQLSEHRFFN
ncbi:putative tubulin polyglutamylase TTLL2 [Aplochiton taeniatus]